MLNLISLNKILNKNKHGLRTANNATVKKTCRVLASIYLVFMRLAV